MAVDSKDKRSSAINVGSAWRGQLPAPGTLTQPDRQHVPYLYRGIAAGNVAGNYYVDATGGSDSNDGLTTATAWQTITKVNASTFAAGSTISFKRGQTHSGSIAVPSSGSAGNQIVFGAYGSGSDPIISSGASTGFSVYNLQYITVQNLKFIGTGTGVSIYKDSGGAHHQSIRVTSVEVQGCDDGISVSTADASGYNDIIITNPTVHDGGTGIFIGSDSGGNLVHTDITVTGGSVYDCSLNGTVIGNSTDSEISYHETYRNGGASLVGPFGCWMYECTRVVIHHCESHHNESGNGVDGGGFDIDGGCIDCRLEYNYSHDNHGQGFFVFAFTTSTATTGAIVRFNISENDATGGNSLHAGITVSSAGPNVAAEVHNNTVYMSTAGQYACRFTNNTHTVTARFSNNIFQSAGSASGWVNAGTGAALATGASFFGNDYYGPGNIKWNSASYATVALWRAAVPAQETIAAADVSRIVDPLLVDPGNGGTIHAVNSALTAYKLRTTSTLISAGLDLLVALSLNPGSADFYDGTVLTPFAIGASDAQVGVEVASLVIRPGGGNANKQRPWRWWEDGEKEVRKYAKAKVAAAIQEGVLVELTRAGVKAYTTDTVENLVPEISDEALKAITARIVTSLRRTVAQQRQEDDDEEAILALL